VNPVKPSYVLDSYAVLAYLNNETGGNRVQEVLELSQQGNCHALMCLVNLGEVLFMTERRFGLAMTQSVLALVDSLPLVLMDATRDLILNATHLKAHYKISYADAFVVAAAIGENAIILTGDPEFEPVASLVNIEWLVEVNSQG
jgi:PIN domain nuclease of toxin-antitoxin system